MIKQVIFLVAIASIVYALQCNQGTSSNKSSKNCTTAAKQCFKTFLNSSSAGYGCDEGNVLCANINSGSCKNGTQGLTVCCCNDKDNCNFGTSRFSLSALAVPILAMLYFR